MEDLRLFLFSASHHILNGPQERHAIAQAKAFDADVVTWLGSQDNETKQHINDMVRHIMALKRA